MAEEVSPPATIYCPRCRDGGGIASYCYGAGVTTTGVRKLVYRCQGCDWWLAVRWAPERPDKIIVADLRKEKP
jgi:hypothetical protein